VSQSACAVPDSSERYSEGVVGSASTSCADPSSPLFSACSQARHLEHSVLVRARRACPGCFGALRDLAKVFPPHVLVKIIIANPMTILHLTRNCQGSEAAPCWLRCLALNHCSDQRHYTHPFAYSNRVGYDLASLGLAKGSYEGGPNAKSGWSSDG